MPKIYLKGLAIVRYERYEDANKAIKDYNGKVIL
jgi:hypothetical protein